MTLEEITARLVGRKIVAVDGYVQENIGGNDVGFNGRITLDDGTVLRDIGLHGNDSAIVVEDH